MNACSTVIHLPTMKQWNARPIPVRQRGLSSNRPSPNARECGQTSAVSQSSSPANASETPSCVWFAESLAGSNSIRMLYCSYSKKLCQTERGKAGLRRQTFYMSGGQKAQPLVHAVGSSFTPVTAACSFINRKSASRSSTMNANSAYKRWGEARGIGVTLVQPATAFRPCEFASLAPWRATFG